MSTTAQLAALLPLPALALVALTDLVSRRVPNWVCAFIAGFGLATRAAAGDALPAMLSAALLFALLLFFWSRGWLGGGDVKLLPACALLVPAHAVSLLVFVVVMAGGLLALAYLPGRFSAARRVGARRLSPVPLSWARRILRVEAWRSRRRAPLPTGCAGRSPRTRPCFTSTPNCSPAPASACRAATPSAAPT